MLSGKTPPGEGSAKIPSQTPPDGPRIAPKPRSDLKHPSYYLNRELTWLNFNHRVLHEAEDPRTPLLERVKFLAIVGSNLDEFHMKRIGGLKQQVGAAFAELSVDGRSPRQQIEECNAAVRELTVRCQEVRRKLLKALAHKGVRVVEYEALEDSEQAWLRQHYLDNIFPLVTPQAIDPAHPFPFVSNLSLNLLVHVRDPSEGTSVFTRIKLPMGNGISRHIAVNGTHTFVMLEDVISHNLDLLFPDTIIESSDLFRVTRNAITEKDEEQADDLLVMIESELRERKFAPVVRLQVTAGMDASRKTRLAHEVELSDPEDLVEVNGMLALRDFVELSALPLPELHYPPHRPVDHPAFAEASNVFHAIREAGAVLVHHPYHSFSSSWERFMREAALDPRVRAVKMTLYRTSAETQAVEHLIEAARNGKQVTVVVELKARFDEEANIRWASRLEEAGIHVTYGVVGLKTHAKVTMVVRQDPTGLSRYVHIGTGNYHAGTAKLYTDLGLFTCDEKIGRDVTELFNYLTTGLSTGRQFHKLLIAPRMVKQGVLSRIEREAEHVRAGKRGHLQMKMNALEDPDIVRALYAASQAGVRIELIVRDTCRLRPGVPEVSENISVLSIVGRFLEHSRIFYFHNDGNEEYFIGSADMMTRNLESRVEAVVPIEPPELRAELRRILDIQLNDRRSGWEMKADGSYEQRTPERNESRKGAQEQLIALNQDRYEKALEREPELKARPRKRKAKKHKSEPAPSAQTSEASKKASLVPTSEAASASKPPTRASEAPPSNVVSIASKKGASDPPRGMH
jgi:polyphosphate kinase